MLTCSNMAPVAPILAPGQMPGPPTKPDAALVTRELQDIQKESENSSKFEWQERKQGSDMPV